MASQDLAPYEAKIGTVLKSKWTLERLVGVGGMAAVYAAKHRVGTKAAIKILHPEVARSTELRLRFEREAMVMGKLEHPGAVRVFDIDVTKDGAPFLVMELLAGESLKERMARDRHLPMPELLRVMDETLDVLAAAHAEGIIHRDVKPDNLFLTQDGPVKVLDFGIARMREAAAMTMVGERLGTLPYMPPEQVQGKDIDPRADLFALGALAFRIVAGRRVHDVKTESEMLVAMSSKPAPPLATVCATAPEGLCRVVDRALAFSRDERYPDARTMQADVQALRRGEGPSFAGAPLPAGALESLPMSSTRVPMPGEALSGQAAPMSSPPTRVGAGVASGVASGTAAATPFQVGREGPISEPGVAVVEPTQVSSGAPMEATKVSSTGVASPTQGTARGAPPPVAVAMAPDAQPRGPGYTVLTDEHQASPGAPAVTPAVGAMAGQAYADGVPGAAPAMSAGPTAPASRRDAKPLILLGAAGLLVFVLLFAGIAIALSGDDEEPVEGEQSGVAKTLEDGPSGDGGAFAGEPPAGSPPPIEGQPPSKPGAAPPSKPGAVPPSKPGAVPPPKAEPPPPGPPPPPAQPPPKPTSIKLPTLVPPKDDGPPEGKGPPPHAKGKKKKKGKPDDD